MDAILMYNIRMVAIRMDDNCSARPDVNYLYKNIIISKRVPLPSFLLNYRFPRLGGESLLRHHTPHQGELLPTTNRGSGHSRRARHQGSEGVSNCAPTDLAWLIQTRHLKDVVFRFEWLFMGWAVPKLNSNSEFIACDNRLINELKRSWLVWIVTATDIWSSMARDTKLQIVDGVYDWMTSRLTENNIHVLLWMQLTPYTFLNVYHLIILLSGIFSCGLLNSIPVIYVKLITYLIITQILF